MPQGGEALSRQITATLNTLHSRYRLTLVATTSAPVIIKQDAAKDSFPASIATLAQRQPLRWANVGSPTLGQRGFVNWPNVGPTVARQRWPNVVPTSAQRWRTNVGPTLGQRYANGCMPTLYQHWPNGGCVTGFLWREPIDHRWIPLTKDQERWRWCLPKQSVKQTVELSNRWFETDVIDVNVIFTCLKMWLFCFEDVQTDPNTINVQKNNGLSLAGAKP